MSNIYEMSNNELVLCVQKLRKALVGLVGASEKEELEQMEAALRILPAPEKDKAAMIDAIHAIIDTDENISEQGDG